MTWKTIKTLAGGGEVVVAAVLCFVAVASRGGTASEQIVELPAATNITVEAGDTLRIEYLRGGTTLYKSGEGRLEVAVVGNTNLNVVVSNGTFATSRPGSLDLSGDANVIFHLDANDPASLTTDTRNGTNFVTGASDADGRTDRSLSTLSGRPDAYLSTQSCTGLPMIDLGSLKNTAADGYGAALAFDNALSGGYEILYVFEDDPDAKNREKSIGPCFFGSAGTASLVRGYVNGGVAAPIHYTSIGGRLQDGNYIDGKKYGTAKYDGIPSFYNRPVPDGTHLLRWKVANKSTTPYGAIDAFSGLGYSSKAAALSYGGLKIGEIVVLNETGGGNDTVAANEFVEPYNTYMMRKWLDVATLGKVTLLGDSTLDVSAAPLRAQMQWGSATAILSGGKNLWPKGYFEAGNPAVAVSGAYEVPDGQTQIPGMEFQGDAEVGNDADSKIARIDGSGALRKNGGGTLTVGAHGTGITALDVYEGVLRIAPLESSGAYMHLDAADAASLEYSSGTAISKWSDSENGVNYAIPATIKYNFDQTRRVGNPYLGETSQNGLPLVDFGAYTTELYPDGDGGAFVPNSALSASADSANYPGMRNIFVVWGDYEGLKDLPLNEEAELRGPALLAAGSGWGYRGFGGGGNTFPLLGEEPNGSYYGSGFVKIDGAPADVISAPYTTRPSPGMHLLDQKVSNAGASLDYIGGCRWSSSYYGGSMSATAGVFGGLRIGEILIYRNAIPDWFRARIAAALRRKWFNTANTLEYSSVRVAAGAALQIPESRIETDALVLEGGSLAAEETSAASVALSADSSVSGTLSLDGAVVSVACGADGEVPSVSADALSVSGALSVAFAVSDGAVPPQGEHLVLAAETVSTDGATLSAAVSAAAKAMGVSATLEKRADGIYAVFHSGGTVITLR